MHLWSESYDQTLDDVFAIQDEISAAVVDALKLTLLGQAPKSHKISAEALDLNMQARYFWHRRGEGDLERTRDYYQESVAIDPENAPAWAGLTIIYTELRKAGKISPDEAARLYREAALNAVAADPDYPEGHIRLAWYYASHENPEAAKKERAIAFALDPENHLVIFDRAVQLQFQGRLEESIVLHEKAAALDPLSAISQNNLATFYTWVGRLEEAQVSADRALELSPDMVNLRSTIVELRIVQKRMHEALELVLDLPAGNDRQAYLAIIYFALGDAAASEQAFIQIAPDGGRIPPQAHQIQVHAYRGDLEPAFEFMKQGLERGTHFTSFLYDRFLDNMHDDPRWEPLYSGKPGMTRKPESTVQHLSPGTVCLLGVPWDKGSTHMPGPAGAPVKIREQLFGGAANLCSEAGIDLDGHAGFVDLGDLQPGHGAAAQRGYRRVQP